MFSSVSFAIDKLAVSAVLKRVTDHGTYDGNGNKTPGTELEKNIRMVIQPVSGFELKDLPEGIRSEAKNIAWSRENLINDDLLVVSSITYRVMYVWPRPEGKFTRVALGMKK